MSVPMDPATQVPSHLFLNPRPTFFLLSLSSYERDNVLGWESAGLSGRTGDSLAFCSPLALCLLASSCGLHLEYVDGIQGISNGSDSTSTGEDDQSRHVFFVKYRTEPCEREKPCQQPLLQYSTSKTGLWSSYWNFATTSQRK